MRRIFSSGAEAACGAKPVAANPPEGGGAEQRADAEGQGDLRAVAGMAPFAHHPPPCILPQRSPTGSTRGGARVACAAREWPDLRAVAEARGDVGVRGDGHDEHLSPPARHHPRQIRTELTPNSLPAPLGFSRAHHDDRERGDEAAPRPAVVAWLLEDPVPWGVGTCHYQPF